jgi:hypothetical protein
MEEVLTMYNVGYQMVNTLPNQVTSSNVPAVMNDRALINQRLQALMNMSCLRMRGLPFSAGQKDILKFLSTHADHVVGSVHIIYNLQGRPSGEAFVQLQNPDYAHKCANELHLRHMGERYIEVFQCSVQDMTWMLATSHANQLAAQHLNQLNNNSLKNNVSDVDNNNHHQTTPSPSILPTTQAPPMNGLIATPSSPPITSNRIVPQNIPPIPFFTAPYPSVVSPVHGCFLPPPHMQPTHRIPVRIPGGPPLLQPIMTPLMINPDSFHFPINQFNKINGVTYVAFGSPEEAQRSMQDKHKTGNRYVEMFIGH